MARKSPSAAISNVVLSHRAFVIVGIYVGSIVLINAGFSHAPELELFWAGLAGTVFVTRDLGQRLIGHWIMLPMAAAIVLSYVTADPYVAFASCLAFAVSEIIDWIVYSTVPGSLARRVLVSSCFAVPIDSFVFLKAAGFFSWGLFAIQIASKMLAAGIIAAIILQQEKRRAYHA